MASKAGISHCDSLPTTSGPANRESEGHSRFGINIYTGDKHERTTIVDTDSHDRVHNEIKSDSVDSDDDLHHSKREYLGEEAALWRRQANFLQFDPSLDMHNSPKATTNNIAHHDDHSKRR